MQNKQNCHAPLQDTKGCANGLPMRELVKAFVSSIWPIRLGRIGLRHSSYGKTNSATPDT